MGSRFGANDALVESAPRSSFGADDELVGVAPPAAAHAELDAEDRARYEAMGIPPPLTDEQTKVWERLPGNTKTQIGADLTQQIAGARVGASKLRELYLQQHVSPEEFEAVLPFAGRLPNVAPIAEERKLQREQLAVARQAEIGAGEASPQDAGVIERTIQGGVSSAAESVGAVAIGSLTGGAGAAVGAGLMGVGQGASRYVQLRNLGLSEAESTRSAALTMGLESLTEFLPGKAVLKKFKGFDGFKKKLAEFFISELPGENITTIGEMVDDYANGLRDDITGEDLAQAIGDTTLQTLLAGGIQAGGAHVLQNIAERANETAAQRADRRKPPPDDSIPPYEPPGATAPEASLETPPAAPTTPPAEAPENVERYQFMKNSGGDSPQMEILPLTQQRFIQYVRPSLREGYSATLEDYLKKHPNVTHVAVTRPDPGTPWRVAHWGGAENIMNWLKRHESTLRQVHGFDSPEAQTWAKIKADDAQRRDQNAMSDEDSLLEAISKLGGLSREQAESEGVDPASFARRGAGIKRVFTENGLKAEDLAEILHERGYPVERGGTFSGQELMERVFDELGGRRVLTPRGVEVEATKKQVDVARQEAEQRAALITDLADDYLGRAYTGEEEVQRTLFEPTDYPADFDQRAKNLADLAVMAREHADEDTVQDALTAGTDAQAARELWEIVNRGRQTQAKAAQPKQPRDEPTSAGKPVAAAAPEGQGADAQVGSADEFLEARRARGPSRSELVEMGRTHAEAAGEYDLSDDDLESLGSELHADLGGYEPESPKRKAQTFNVRGFGQVPWAVAEQAHAAYVRKYGDIQSLQQISDRGGFDAGEMDQLYPQWRKKADESQGVEAKQDAGRAGAVGGEARATPGAVRKDDGAAPAVADTAAPAAKPAAAAPREPDRAHERPAGAAAAEHGAVPGDVRTVEPGGGSVATDEKPRRRRKPKAEPAAAGDIVETARSPRAAVPAVNEFKGERWPGFEDAGTLVHGEYDAGAVDPPKKGVNRYVVEIEDGKTAVVDVEAEGIGGRTIEVHGKYASSTGYHSIMGFGDAPLPDGVSEREWADSRVSGNFIKVKAESHYSSFNGPYDRKGIAELSLPYWAGKPVTDVLKKRGWVPKTERGGISGNVYVSREEFTPNEGKALRGLLGFVTKKGTLYQDEAEIAKKLDDVFTRFSGRTQLFEGKPAAKPPKKPITPQVPAIAGTAPLGAKSPALTGLYVEWDGKRYPVESYEDASRKWDAFRNTTGEGASRIGQGLPVFDASGKQVAHVSYNGKVWPGRDQDWKAGDKPLVGQPFKASEDFVADRMKYLGESKEEAQAAVAPIKEEFTLSEPTQKEIEVEGPTSQEMDGTAALREVAHDKDQSGDVMLMNERFVTLDQAKAAALKYMTARERGMPYQYNRLLDIAGRDWNRLVSEFAPPPTQKEINAGAHEAAASPKNALPQPTQAQKEAENYKVGAPVKLYGVTWRVENPKGSYRFKLNERELTGIGLDSIREVGDMEIPKVTAALREGRIPEAFKEAARIADVMDARANEDRQMRKPAKAMRKLLAESWYAKLAAHYARAVGVPGADGDTLDAFLGPRAAAQTLPVYVIDTNHLDGSGFDEHKVMLGFDSAAAARKAFDDSYNGDVASRIFGAITEMLPEDFKSWVGSDDVKRPASPSIKVKGKADEPAAPRAPEAGKPAGAQPEALPPPAPSGPAGGVRGVEGAGSASGATEPRTLGLFDGRGVGSGEERLSQAAGSAAVDFGRDRRPGRNLEGDHVDGRSAESRRAKEHGSVVGSSDYVITADDALGQGGAKTKAKQNIEAIHIVRRLAEEQRAATSEEQRALVKYVGWGGIPQIFDATKKDWAKEYAELKLLLTPEEYDAARRSTQDAHYTSETVVRGIYSALAQLGFKGGKVLEPAAGTGHFFGLMPEALREQAQPTGVELDPITALIANALYPKIKTHQTGFQDFQAPDGFYDAVIGNPPFGDQKLFDPQRKALNEFSIHNYFIAKAVELTRPGGIVSVVVSRYFMDSLHPKAREYIARQTRLLGAIRLPNTAFADNANTEVVTDIVFLQKKPADEHTAVITGIDWTSTKRLKMDDGTDVPINNYFLSNPTMVLGRHATTGKMYRGNDYTVEPTGDLKEQLAAAIALLPKDVVTDRVHDQHQEDLERAVIKDVDPSLVENVQVYGYFERAGAVLQRMPDQAGEPRAEQVDVDGAGKERMLALIKLRDAVRRQLRLELSDDPAMEKNRREINKLYDAFERKYGYVHAQGNKNVFSGDPSYPLLAALEIDYDRGISSSTAKSQGVAARKPSAKKAAIFAKRVLVPFRAVERVTNSHDALMATLAQRGRIDPEYMTGLYPEKPFDAQMTELGDRVYEDHDGSGWTTADAYLSGNVKAKLKAAAAAAKRDGRFARNVQALSGVIPADLDPVDISVGITTPWVPGADLEKFAVHLFGEGTHAKIIYVPALGKFSAKINAADRVKAGSVWGTDRMTGPEILGRYLAGTPLKIYDKVGDDSVFNAEATMAATEKLEQMRNEFRDWIWQDEERRTRLARTYNDTFNTNVERIYDGSHLGRTPDGRPQPLPGASPAIELRPHQKNFVWRFVQTGRVLADHVVGAGKTFAFITAVMERKRIGLIRKPMFTVPNHLVEQWASDFYKLYPGAKLLAATKRDFQKENRRQFMAKIATGDWDAVIVAHSSFGFIGMPLDTLQEFISMQIADIESSKEAMAGSNDKRSIKQMEKAKERLEAKYEAQIESSKKDDLLSFDELGVDALIVDEAHEFSNLMYATSLGRNIAGLGNTEGSLRAMDLFVKTQHVLGRNANQNVGFATGTPIRNTIAQMYTVQRYMALGDLRDHGLAHFDSWANTFADAVADWEIKASGQGYELKTRFRAFQNFPELMRMYRDFADVVTQHDLKRMREAEGKPHLTPPIAGGGPQNIVVPRSAWQASYMNEIVGRAERLSSVDPKEDNMLKITNDARKMALDMRLIDPAANDYEKSKTNDAVRRIKGFYDQYHAHKGTQFVFIDLSTPKGNQSAEQRRIAEIVQKAEEGDEAAAEAMAQLSPDEILSSSSLFDVYNDVKAKLVKAGIPEQEVEFIHSANTELRKEALFERMRQGITRVLLGSTPKMGAGTNVQRRLVALHHLDAPWRPSDLEQREGRIVRQGNLFYDGDPDRGVAPLPNFAVSLFRYATEQTYDARMWQTIENKARFIEQARHANMIDRRVEDIGGEAANAAQMKAAASGNPLIEEEIKLRADIKKIENLEREHKRKEHSLQAFLKNNARVEEDLRGDLELIDKDITQREPKGEEFSGITVRGKKFTDRKKGGMAVAIELAQFIKSERDSENELGRYRGFDFFFAKDIINRPAIALVGKAHNYTTVFNTEEALDPVGIVTRLDNLLERLEERRADVVSTAARRTKEVASAKGEIGKPFTQADDLQQKRARHVEVLKELSAKKKDETGAAEGLEAAFGGTAEKRHGLGVQAIEPFVHDLVTRWKGLTVPVIVTTRRDLSRVPDVVKRGIEYLDPRNRMVGLNDAKRGAIYLFADNLVSLSEAERYLIHEAKGHFGVHALLGDSYQKWRERAFKLFPALAEEQAKHTGADLRTAAGRDRVGNEIFAVLAERLSDGSATQAMRKFWDRLYAAILRTLRAHGFKAEYTQHEIRNIVRSAARAVELGTLHAGSKASEVQGLEAALIDPDNEEDLAKQRAKASGWRSRFGLEAIFKDGQPVDQAFSKVFNVFGSIDSRRVFHVDPRAKVMAKRAYDAAGEFLASDRFTPLHSLIARGRASLNARYDLDEKARVAIETVKRGIIDRYGLSTEYRARSQQAINERRATLMLGEDMVGKLLEAGVEAKEAEVLYRLMTVDGASEQEQAELGEDIKKLVPEIRDAVTQIGREFVELGMLSAASFEKWRDTYLPRSYLGHERDRSSLGRAFGSMLDARRKRIQGQQFRGRGIRITKSQERILRDVPEDWWGRKQKEGEADKALHGAEFVVLERSKQVGAGTLDLGADMGQKDVQRRVSARIYWPAELPIPQKWAGFDNLGTFEVEDVTSGDVTLWRDFTQDERGRMGEIVDARYAVAKFFTQAANDLANGRLFRDIARNQDWASVTDPVGDSPNASERMGSTGGAAEWVRVPETKAAGTEVARYGALSGMYVRAEIWNDLNQMQHMQKAGFWKAVMTTWKINKTARNPVVHFNNVASNVVLADLMDIRARDFVKGVRAYVEEDAHYRAALEHGAFGGDYTTQELKRTVLDPILKQMEEESKDEQDGLWKAAGLVWSTIKAGDALMIKAYRMEDEVFRMAAYMREIDRGSTPAEAAQRAREQFLDYDIRAPWINQARAYYLPFIAYTYRAVPAIARSLADRPWKILKWGTLWTLFNMLAYMVMDDDDEDEERATLRPEEQGYTWLGVPRMIRWPQNDRFGNPIFWDVRRLLPAGDIFDTNQGSSALPVPAPLNLGGPLMMAAELFLNRAGFTGDEIVDPLTDTTGEKFWKVGDYLWKSYAPTAPWVPGSWYYSKIEAAATGELDPVMREYSVPLAISSSLGMKLKPHDVDLQRRYQLMDIERVQRALGEDMRSLAMDLQRRRINREFYDAQVAKLQQKMETLNERRRELAPR